MKKTDENTNEILQIVRLLQKYDNTLGNYVEHYQTLEPSNGFRVVLDDDSTVFVHKMVVQDFKLAQRLDAEIAKCILQSYKKI